MVVYTVTFFKTSNYSSFSYGSQHSGVFSRSRVYSRYRTYCSQFFFFHAYFSLYETSAAVKMRSRQNKTILIFTLFIYLGYLTLSLSKPQSENAILEDKLKNIYLRNWQISQQRVTVSGNVLLILETSHSAAILDSFISLSDYSLFCVLCTQKKLSVLQVTGYNLRFLLLRSQCIFHGY